MKTMVTVNKDTNTVYIDGERYALSTSEIMLLEFLYSNPGVIFPANEISKKCWPGRVVSYASVPVAIKHIRDVFSANNGWRGIIQTKKGEGYKFCENGFVINFVNCEYSKNSESTMPDKIIFGCGLFIFPVIIFTLYFLFI
ncbi:hypothetical protein YI53_004568 [Salmonella enterica subsp. enterica]|nr:hypothetical protein [Salmonella enterica subsp. enterica]